MEHTLFTPFLKIAIVAAAIFFVVLNTVNAEDEVFSFSTTDVIVLLVVVLFAIGA